MASSLVRSVFGRFSKRDASEEGEFTKAPGPEALFPKTDPAVDGEECLHDCDSCSVRLPRKWEIDTEDTLYGHVNGWQRHILIATGKTDWVRDVADEAGSLMEAVAKHSGEVEGGKLMVSATNLPVPESKDHDGPYGHDRPTSVLLLPAFQMLEGVTPANIPEVIKAVVNRASVNTSSLPPSTPIATSTAGIPNGNGHVESKDDKPSNDHDTNIPPLPPGVTIGPHPRQYLILLCSQGTRDARCGQSAPLIRKELERHLRPLGLHRDFDDSRPGGVGIYFINHVGGHKYSANMMVYRRPDATSSEAAQCMWLARVRPEDCENIVRYTVLQGKLVKPNYQLRAGFDRERKLLSW